MSGMNIPSSPGVSDYQNRTVTIDVTGVRQQAVHKRGSYQVKVSYSQMSQTMQTIHRRGGQVAAVTVTGAPGSGAADSTERSDSPAPADEQL